MSIINAYLHAAKSALLQSKNVHKIISIWVRVLFSLQFKMFRMCFFFLSLFFPCFVTYGGNGGGGGGNVESRERKILTLHLATLW